MVLRQKSQCGESSNVRLHYARFGSQPIHTRTPPARHRGPPRNLQSDRQPPAERRYRRPGLCGSGLYRGRRIRPRAGPDQHHRQQGDGRPAGEPGAPGRDRRRARPFHRPAPRHDRWRRGGGHLLSADPDAEQIRRGNRSAQSWLFARLSHPSRGHQPLGACSARRTAGRSSGAPCAWSTARNLHARFCAARSALMRRDRKIRGNA